MRVCFLKCGTILRTLCLKEILFAGPGYQAKAC